MNFFFKWNSFLKNRFHCTSILILLNLRKKKMIFRSILLIWNWYDELKMNTTCRFWLNFDSSCSSICMTITIFRINFRLIVRCSIHNFILIRDVWKFIVSFYFFFQLKIKKREINIKIESRKKRKSTKTLKSTPKQQNKKWFDGHLIFLNCGLILMFLKKCWSIKFFLRVTFISWCAIVSHYVMIQRSNTMMIYHTLIQSLSNWIWKFDSYFIKIHDIAQKFFFLLCVRSLTFNKQRNLDEIKNVFSFSRHVWNLLSISMWKVIYKKNKNFLIFRWSFVHRLLNLLNWRI